MNWPAKHEHVCLTVGGDEDMESALRGFVAQLADRDGIFVHRTTDEAAWSLLHAAGVTAAQREAGVVRAVGRVPAFQGTKSTIDHGHVASVVEAAADQAARRGRGLAILADASHAYIDEGRAAEWFAFESWLGRRMARDSVLVCLYWEADLREPSVLDPMVRTHSARWQARPLAALVAA